jgi:hypothetical protein
VTEISSDGTYLILSDATLGGWSAFFFGRP